MGRRSPSYSPARRSYDRRGHSPPSERYGIRSDAPTSLLVRNIPRENRAEDVRIPFERFGPIKDVYLPKDYYTGEPRGFGFVQYFDPYDAAEAKHYMDHRIFNGREITVVFAEENRKRPDEMRNRGRSRGRTGYGGRRWSPYYGRSRSRSRSRSPRYRTPSPRGRRHLRSPSPTPRHTRYLHSPSPVKGRKRFSVSPSDMHRRTRGHSPSADRSFSQGKEQSNSRSPSTSSLPKKTSRCPEKRSSSRSTHSDSLPPKR